MKLGTSKSVIADNLTSVNPYLGYKQAIVSKKKLCWSCQKDKSTKNGHIKTFKNGPMKFVCEDCLVKKTSPITAN